MYDDSHVIQVDDLEVSDNLTVDTWSVKIEDREVKRLRGKEIVLVKVIWVGLTGESATWESESRMKDSYPELFPSGNFRGRKSFGNKMLETQISQVAQQVATSSQTPGIFPRQTEANPKAHVNVISLGDCRKLEDTVTARFFVILFSIILCVFIYACM